MGVVQVLLERVKSDPEVGHCAGIFDGGATQIQLYRRLSDFLAVEGEDNCLCL